MVAYPGTRDIAMFSCDLGSFDFKASTPDKIETAMTKVNKLGRSEDRGDFVTFDGTSSELPEPQASERTAP
jgi:hypothetical protein